MDKEEFLQRTNGGKDFYELAMNGEICTRKNYKNPFYQDTKPALSFTFLEGQYFFKDFGDDSYRGDVFSFAGHHYNLDTDTQLNEIIQRMALDLHLVSGSNGNIKTLVGNPGKVRSDVKTFPTNIKRVQFKKFTDPDRFKFWYQYGDKQLIDEALDRYNVMAWKSFQQGNLTIANKDYPIFAIPTGAAFKIYQPGHPKYKGSWLGQKSEGDDIYGVGQLPDKCDGILIVEGPLTDMVVASTHGFNTIALDNAGTKPASDLIHKLKDKSGQVILCLDNDSKGVEAMKALSQEHQLPYLVLPEKFTIGNTTHENWGKDISDFFKLVDGDASAYVEYLNNLLENDTVSSETPQLLQTLLVDGTAQRGPLILG